MMTIFTSVKLLVRIVDLENLNWKGLDHLVKILIL